MDKEFPDYMQSFEASTRLVDQILKYWNTRGYYPDVWVEGVPIDSKSRKKLSCSSIVYIIRSDMVNGIPQRRVH